MDRWTDRLSAVWMRPGAIASVAVTDVHYRDDALLIRRLVVGELENNVFVVACSQTGRAAVIDAAGEPDRIEAALSDLEPIVILTTHGHHDHVGAAVEMRERLHVPLRIHPADAAQAGFVPDPPLEHGEELGVGSLRLRVIHTPGHTPGSTCFTLPGHLFSGDTLFPGGPGATGGRPGSSFPQIIGSIQNRLFTLPDDTRVHPGHGLDTTIGTERPQLPEWIARGW